MSLIRFRELRFLYLLAMLQLVGGPLVLLHVTVFCKLTLDEAPGLGMSTSYLAALTTSFSCWLYFF